MTVPLSRISARSHASITGAYAVMACLPRLALGGGSGGTAGPSSSRYFLTVRQFSPVSRAISEKVAPDWRSALNRRSSPPLRFQYHPAAPARDHHPNTGEAPPITNSYQATRRDLCTFTCTQLCTTACTPTGTEDEELIRVAGARWAVEECFQSAKNETGLDHYQVRRYDAWYRHATLAVLARAYLDHRRERPKSPGSSLVPVTLAEVRRLLAHLITTTPARAATWAWSSWRRHHQYQAKTSHHRRRQATYSELLLVVLVLQQPLVISSSAGVVGFAGGGLAVASPV